MNFEQALHMIKNGSRMRRGIWPKHVYIYRYLAPFPGAMPMLVAHHAHLEDPDWRPLVRDLFAVDWEEHRE